MPQFIVMSVNIPEALDHLSIDACRISFDKETLKELLTLMDKAKELIEFTKDIALSIKTAFNVDFFNLNEESLGKEEKLLGDEFFVEKNPIIMGMEEEVQSEDGSMDWTGVIVSDDEVVFYGRPRHIESGEDIESAPLTIQQIKDFLKQV